MFQKVGRAVPCAPTGRNTNHAPRLDCQRSKTHFLSELGKADALLSASSAGIQLRTPYRFVNYACLAIIRQPASLLHMELRCNPTRPRNEMIFCQFTRRRPDVKKTISLIILLMLAATCLIGCRQADTDVTSSPEYNFAAFSGTVWRTKVGVVVADVKRYTGAHEITLFRQQDFDTNNPNRLEVPNSQQIAVLPVGTRLRIEHLMHDNGNWGGVEVTARILDDTNYQKSVYLGETMLAKNQFLNIGEPFGTNWGVDKKVLEK
jgi:hypothetical protein